jgi:hypothetical protein
MGELRMMGRSGDDLFRWDSGNVGEVKEAREKFNSAKERGCLMFLVDPSGGRGDRITEFVPNAERIIVVPQMAGGN